MFHYGKRCSLVFNREAKPWGIRKWNTFISFGRSRADGTNRIVDQIRCLDSKRCSFLISLSVAFTRATPNMALVK